MKTSERLIATGRLRSWEDKIPFHYEYTAGVAGERFLRGLIEGRILGARCETCGITYLPPKMYCTNCFDPIKKNKDLGLIGRIDALSKVFVDFGGARARKPYQIGFIAFRNVTGGIIHRVTGNAEIGSTVRAKFKPKAKRKGSMTDIVSFEAVS